MGRKAISEKTKKRIIIKSGGICALTKESCIDEGINTGEFCHFDGYSPNGPRYNPNVQNKNEEENLAFFHSPKNKVIDTHVEKYTTEVLKDIKSSHENEIAERQNSFKQNNINFWEQNKKDKVKK